MQSLVFSGGLASFGTQRQGEQLVLWLKHGLASFASDGGVESTKRAVLDCVLSVQLGVKLSLRKQRRPDRECGSQRSFENGVKAMPLQISHALAAVRTVGTVQERRWYVKV